MEKLKLSPRCKLCALFDKDVALWEEAHRRVLILGESRTQVAEWLNTRLDVLNAGHDPADIENYITPFHQTTVYNHFRSHVISVEEMEQALTAGVHYTQKDLRRNDPKAASAQAAKAPFLTLSSPAETSEEVEDYCRMQRLVSAAEDRLTMYNGKLLAKDRAEQDRPVDLSEIQLFQKLIKELMGMKKELAVLQSSEAIAGAALQEAIEQIVNLTVGSLKDVLIEMRSNIARELPGSSLPQQMEGLVLNTVGSALKDAIPVVLKNISKKYKIK